MTIEELLEKINGGIALGVINLNSQVYLDDSELKSEELPIHVYAQDGQLTITAFEYNATEL